MSSPLRIAVLGAGKIGSAFAFQLARAGGHEVTVIARPGSARLAELEQDQAIVDVRGARAQVQVAGELDETINYDLLIVTLLAHQAEPLLPALRRCQAGCIQFMFNTFNPERLQSALGPERCAFGMPFIQATLDQAGRLKVLIGAGGQRTLMDQQRWVDVFSAAKLPAKLETRMPLWLRCHAPLCIAFESACDTAERQGAGVSWEQALRLARGVRAVFALITILGYEVYPAGKKRIATNPAWAFAAILWFMSRVASFRKLLATGRAEAEKLVDDITSSIPASASPEMIAQIEAMRPAGLV